MLSGSPAAALRASLRPLGRPASARVVGTLITQEILSTARFFEWWGTLDQQPGTPAVKPVLGRPTREGGRAMRGLMLGEQLSRALTPRGS
jgi:hypothetical protein